MTGKTTPERMTRPWRVLAVDDQPANLLLVRRALAAAGCEVLEARSGVDALTVAKETAPDLILLDMHLPDMHGLEVLRRLRESTWGARLRVVAFSALASTEDQALWRQAGCLGVIEKPITVADFPQEIARWLHGPADSGADLPAREEQTDRLGAMLLAHGLISGEQLASAVAAQAGTGSRLGQVLVQQGALSEDDLAWALSNQLGYPYVFLSADIIDEEAARVLPEAFLRERHILPILKFGQEVTLAMADPTDQGTVDEVLARTGLQVKRALALSSNIEGMLDRLFTRRPGVQQQAPAEVQYLQFHLRQALQEEATEIHFDPGIDGQARVRYRLQGTLVDRPAQPAELHAAILRYLRDLTGADDQPAGRGAGALAVGDVDLQLVTAFLPTATGPAATVTFYSRRSELPDLARLGLLEERVAPLRRVLRGRGVVLVGCTDPWVRSTLLHALVAPLQGGKVWTLETLPVYRRPTLQQTFLPSGEEVASHVRTVAAAGADLILADDLSPAAAMRAALEAGRGRMLLGGHPQDAVLDLLTQVLDGCGTALVAATLRGILAARPIRLLCPHCRQAGPGTAGTPEPRAFSAPGCEACGLTGFQGQRLLTEVWLPDEDDRMMLRTGRQAAVLERVAAATGTQMRAQGRALVEDGLTAPEELARVLEGDLWTSPTS